MKLRKTVLVLILAVCAVWSAFGQKTELSFWTWRPEDTEKYKVLLASFEKQNPGITVKISDFKSTSTIPYSRRPSPAVRDPMSSRAGPTAAWRLSPSPATWSPWRSGFPK